MRRGFLLVLTLLPFTAAALAQAPGQVPALPPPPAPAPAQALVQTEAPIPPPAVEIQGHGMFAIQGHGMFAGSSPTLIARASPDDLVARIMSFDRNSDGNVTTDELNERMQPLVSRADRNGDHALDSTELRTIASAPVQNPTSVRGFPASAGGYGFGDAFGQTSRLHIEGAIDDLRLSADTRDRALAAAKSFVDTFEASSSATFLKEMEPLLTAEQLAELKQALEAEGSAQSPLVLTLGHDQADGKKQSVLVLEGSHGRAVALQRLVVELRFSQFKLAAAQRPQAQAAVERFTARSRMGDAERSMLIEQLRGILSDDERDDLRAALERRPVVKAGSTKRFAVSHAVGEGVAVGFHKVVDDATGSVR